MKLLRSNNFSRTYKVQKVKGGLSLFGRVADALRQLFLGKVKTGIHSAVDMTTPTKREIIEKQQNIKFFISK